MNFDLPIYTVSRLLKEIRGHLEPPFEGIWVEGEISNFRAPGSGHYYFSLKDEAGQIRAVFFRAQNRLLKFSLENGLQVVCFGRLSLYEPRGDLQLILDLVEPRGLGALQLAFEQLKERLERRGFLIRAVSARSRFLLKRSRWSPPPPGRPSGIF
jgi:exodeoxyribonuclease VII large subunit